MNSFNDAATDFAARRDRELRRYHARKPKPIANVIANLITTRGYGRIQATADFTAAWQKAAGQTLATYTRPGQLRRGILEITVANSAIVQELTFQKQKVLADLRAEVPDAKIRDLRFRIGTID